MNVLEIKFNVDKTFKQAFEDLNKINRYMNTDDFYSRIEEVIKKYRIKDAGLDFEIDLDEAMDKEIAAIKTCVLNCISKEEQSFTLLMMARRVSEVCDKRVLFSKKLWGGLPDNKLRDRLLSECEQFKSEIARGFDMYESSTDMYFYRDLLDHRFKSLLNRSIYSNGVATVYIPLRYIYKYKDVEGGYEDGDNVLDYATKLNSMKVTNFAHSDVIARYDMFAEILNKLRKYLGTFGDNESKIVTSMQILIMKSSWCIGDNIEKNIDFTEEKIDNYSEICFSIPASRNRFGANVDMRTFDANSMYSVKIVMGLREDLHSLFNQMQSNLEYFKEKGLWVNKDNVDEADDNIFNIFNQVLNMDFSYKSLLKYVDLFATSRIGLIDRLDCVRGLPEVQNLFVNQVSAFYNAEHPVSETIGISNLASVKENSVAGGQWIFEGMFVNTSYEIIEEWFRRIKSSVGTETTKFEIKDV